MSDVLLFHAADGGEIQIENGRVQLSNTYETAVYLSLFGGNERDAGLTATASLQWWGNFGEDDEARQYRSETQHLIRSLPAIPANLRRIEDAAQRDLEWMLSEGIDTIRASATIPAHDTVALDIELDCADETFRFRFES